MTFDRNGIDHLSAGSLNLWIANPRQWAARYLANEPDDGDDPDLWRGIAVETGLAHWLAGRSIDQARTAACDTFELNAVGDLSDAAEGERAVVPAMVKHACAWRPPGALMATQVRIEHWLDGVAVPLVGFVDFAFDSAIDVDLKTARACPSAPRGNHVRQVALYRAARGRRGGVLYVTAKRFAFYDVSDADARAALNTLRAAAARSPAPGRSASSPCARAWGAATPVCSGSASGRA